MTNTSDYSNIAKVWDDNWIDEWVQRVRNYRSREGLVALYPKKSVQPFRLTPARGSEQYVKALNSLIARLV